MAEILISSVSRRGVNYAIPSAAVAGDVLPAGNIANAGMHIARLYISGAAPGAGESTSITLFVNGVASLLVATLADDAVSAGDLTHSINIASGDAFTFKRVDSGGTVTQNVAIQFSILP